MYNINRRLGAMNLYCILRKIDVATGKLSKLEMNKNYHLKKKYFKG
jgi:hypothetical protein